MYNCVTILTLYGHSPSGIIFMTLKFFLVGEELNLIMKLEAIFSAPNQPDYQRKEQLFYLFL